MKTFTIHNSEGEILRVGTCADKDFKFQAQEGEFIIEALANQQTQKVIGVGQFRWIVNKTPEEIEAEKPPEPKPVPIGQQLAFITNEQWQDVLSRLTKLETEA